VVGSQLGQIVPQDSISKKPFTKKRLVEWLKVGEGSELSPAPKPPHQQKQRGRELRCFVSVLFYSIL
jgi:hypothetical protein